MNLARSQAQVVGDSIGVERFFGQVELFFVAGIAEYLGCIDTGGLAAFGVDDRGHQN